MKITLINVGNIQDKYVKEGISIFEKRIKRYCSFEIVNLNEPRNMKIYTEMVQKDSEGKLIKSVLAKIDRPVLLDVTGEQLSSEGFAKFIQQSMNRGTKNLGFITGGPFGFSNEIYEAIPLRLSLSPMTFSHQIVRLIFLEQLYRAFTIIRGEPYHHA